MTEPQVTTKISSLTLKVKSYVSADTRVPLNLRNQVLDEVKDFDKFLKETGIPKSTIPYWRYDRKRREGKIVRKHAIGTSNNLTQLTAAQLQTVLQKQEKEIKNKLLARIKKNARLIKELDR